jgi:LysM repeat protein
MMTKRILFVLMIAMLLLSSCRRPASEAPVETAPVTPPEGGFPLPGTAVTDVMGQLEVFATQTAQAALGTVQVLPTQQGGAPTLLATLEQAPTLDPSQPTAAVQQTAVPTAPNLAQPTATQPPPTAPIEIPEFDVPNRYTLQKGEFIYCIARRFNVNPNELLSLNGLSGNQTVYPGMRLEIPKTGNTFPGSRQLRDRPTTYTVVSGDTIHTIACQFGDVDPRAIAAANGLQEPYRINAGQKLQIP